MTNIQALQAQFNFPLKPASFELALINEGVDPQGEYTVEGKKGIDLAIAGLVMMAVTSPRSVSELDYSISAADIEDMLNIRSLILSRYGLPDELAQKGSVIQDATHFWGTTNY